VYKPKITIITVTLNSEKTLERAIKSILSQNYSNLEYIIIDGGSKDNTLNIIKKYENHISKWISEPDKGISDAFNKGICMASGEIVGLINSDDGLFKNALHKLAGAYEKNIDVYRGKVLLWNTTTGSKIVEIPSMHFRYAPLKMNISHQSTFIRLDAYKKYGMFNINYKYSMDFDLLMRFEKMGAKFKYVDQILSYFTLGGLTFTNYTTVRRKETETILKSHGAKWYHILKFRIIKYTKVYIKKFICIDKLLKIKNS